MCLPSSPYTALIVCPKFVVAYFMVCSYIWGQSGLFKRHLLGEDSNGQQSVLEKISLVTCARCRPGWGHEQKIVDTVQKSSCTGNKLF